MLKARPDPHNFWLLQHTLWYFPFYFFHADFAAVFNEIFLGTKVVMSIGEQVDGFSWGCWIIVVHWSNLNFFFVKTATNILFSPESKYCCININVFFVINMHGRYTYISMSLPNKSPWYTQSKNNSVTIFELLPISVSRSNYNSLQYILHRDLLNKYANE